MATSSISKTTVEMEFEKETPNTVRFKEVHEETAHPVLRSLYLSKPDHASLGKPMSISVTIEAV